MQIIFWFSFEQFDVHRKYIVTKTLNHQPLNRLPYIEYTAEETNTWRTVFNNLTKLHASHACNEYQKEFQLLVEHCGYCPDNIPQLEDVSTFLKSNKSIKNIKKQWLSRIIFII